MEKCYRYTAEEWEALIDKAVEQFNNSTFADRDEFDGCAVCRNKRKVAHRYGKGQESYRRIADCACMDMIRRQEAMKRSGMGKLLMKYGFENFLARAPWQKRMLEQARACVDAPNWLLLCGQSGSGKTHLAAALCRELIARGQQVVYMSWPGSARDICAAAFDYDRRKSLLKPFLEAPVLLLDDLFKTRLKENGVPDVSRQELDLAFELIDHRLVQDLRTIITCEVSTARLRQLSEALTGRILEKAGRFVQDIRPAEDRNWRTTNLRLIKT